MTVYIQDVIPLDNYRLNVIASNGTQVLYDVKPLLSLSVFEPVMGEFHEVYAERTRVVWPRSGNDIPVWQLFGIDEMDWYNNLSVNKQKKYKKIKLISVEPTSWHQAVVVFNLHQRTMSFSDWFILKPQGKQLKNEFYNIKVKGNRLVWPCGFYENARNLYSYSCAFPS